MSSAGATAAVPITVGSDSSRFIGGADMPVFDGFYSSLEHDLEKWVPVFSKTSCSDDRLERYDDSSRSRLILKSSRSGDSACEKRAACRPTCRPASGGTPGTSAAPADSVHFRIHQRLIPLCRAHIARAVGLRH